ncbi:M3 family oligoendopeptidase [Mesobacillus maritimus]|uniref:M3 family oligoendopeptidase n=1 Tax=Mesobacillus maritimus TaxID=1643336 RepID=UPI00203FE98D|nr:M3 family oligoendopeptidase [Mesobacillus maritimus]MCM3670687.1 M3 family oligoendopeptidase [Mesobacillus maritimus]
MEIKPKENWDLDRLYPGGKESEDLHTLITTLQHDLPRFKKRIRSIANDQSVEEIVTLLDEIQQCKLSAFQLDEYLICLYSVNLVDPDITKLINESATIKAGMDALLFELDAELANLPQQQWSQLLNHQQVKAYNFYLTEHKQQLLKKLPLEKEKIITELSVNGFVAWEDYYEQMMGDLRFLIEKDGKEEEMSLGQAMSYGVFSNNRSLRQKTSRTIVDGLKKRSESFATVLNRIYGFRLDVYKQRGWTNVLQESLQANRINEQSVQAMISAIKENLDIAYQFFNRKAKVMKLDRLAWYDTEAPSFPASTQVTYSDARNSIVTQFYQFSEELGEFSERAFDEGWIEAENRKGKMHGGFCAFLPLHKESRIFLTFTDSYQDVVTIAHELGHAYHNHILRDEPAFTQEVSTSVAETASTFAENLVLDAAIAEASSDDEKLALLEMKILNGLKYQVMVPAMFEFEQKLYKLRQQGPITGKEISALMDSMLKDVYGDDLAESNPYLWMTIPQFFSTKLAFYNIPYTIGYLFSNGIYALAKEHGTKFVEQYDALLKNSGRMTVEDLVSTYLEKDITEKEFWETSLQPTIAAIDEYLRLTEKMI